MSIIKQAIQKQARLYRFAKDNWSTMTVFEKYATMQRLAHKPIMLNMGLNKRAVQSGEGFMVYAIDQAKNNSKFYEGLIVPENGGFQIKRRWGALTDSGQTGRIDGAKFDEDERFFFPSLGSAKRELRAHYAKRLSRGYVDAFGPDHVSPVDGLKLPMGQYPVGLSRKPGFGWGQQSVTQCLPSLKYIMDDLAEAKMEIQQNKTSDTIEDTLDHAVGILSRLAHEDSTMAGKLKQAMAKMLRRVRGSVRFLPDPEGVALTKEINMVMRYISKQTSYCGGIRASVTAMEHSTDEARKKYLHEHPNADPARHQVKKQEQKQQPSGESQQSPSSDGGGEATPEKSKHEVKLEKLESSRAKSVSNLAKKLQVPEADMEKLVAKAERGGPYHPNLHAFKYLFPKAKKFDFPDLDFANSYSEDDLKSQFGITKNDLNKYNTLSGELQKAEDRKDKMNKVKKQMKKK